MQTSSSNYPRAISSSKARQINLAWQRNRNRFIFDLYPRINDTLSIHFVSAAVGHFQTTFFVGINKSAASGHYRVHFLRCIGAELDIAIDFTRTQFPGSELDFRKFISDELFHFRSLAEALFYASIGNVGQRRIFFWSTDPAKRREDLSRLHATLTGGFLGKSASELWKAREEFCREGSFPDTVITIGVPVFFAEPGPKKDFIFKPFELIIEPAT